MRRIQTVIGLIGLVCLVPVIALADANGSLPRYSLPVGRQLTYTGESHFNYQSGSFDSTSTVQMTAVAVNPDGSARLVVRGGERESQNRTGQAAAPPSEERVEYSQLDVLPNGKVVSITGGFNADAPQALPPLPADAAEMAGTWTRQAKLPGRTDTFKSSSIAPGRQWVFTSTDDGIFKKIYGISNEQTVQFDLAQGMVTQIDSKVRQDYGFKGTGVDTLHLDSDRTVPPDQLAQLAKDAATLQAASDDEAKKSDAIGSSSSDAAKTAVEMKAALTVAQNQVTTPEIKAQIGKMINDVDNNLKYEAEDAKRIAAVKGTQAFDFTATDLDGKEHKLSDYRGKVVVLDFWYRGCGWCMRAMPQMKQVADDFCDKPVVVIGLNTDSKIEDARFVVDAMGLQYTTLRIANDVAGKFSVQGFPSLLVIDSNGVIREFDEGYSPTLRKDLDAKIQAILDGKATPSAVAQ